MKPYELHKTHAEICGSLHKAIHYAEAGQPGNFMMEINGKFLKEVKKILEMYVEVREEINRHG